MYYNCQYFNISRFNISRFQLCENFNISTLKLVQHFKISTSKSPNQTCSPLVGAPRLRVSHTALGGSGAGGESRYVERCWGFPYLKIFVKQYSFYLLCMCFRFSFLVIYSPCISRFSFLVFLLLPKEILHLVLHTLSIF